MQSRGAGVPWNVREAADAASRAQAHRGPDGEGLWCSAPEGNSGSVTALAHRRLAILDPSPAGAQPMHDPATGNVLVLNGEIYNHRALRADLPGPWRSGSDTETLLRAYAVWGEACLERLRGMFAFALWDARAGVLFCARDRFGIKPLYLVEGARGIALASEVRALLASGSAQPRLDREALYGYLRFGCVQEPRTLIEGVRSVPAGHALVIRDGQVVREAAWWNTRERIGKHAAQADLGALLADAVAEHLESDVPVGWLLSGGLDASVLLALASKRRGPGQPAFTLAWSDAALDESAPAAEVARHVGAAHTVVRLGDDEAVAQVEQAVAAFDQPTIDGVNTWLIARAIRGAGIKVAISGLGGDELFGGYPSFKWVPQAERWAPLLGFVPAWGRRLFLGAARAERAGELWARGATSGERVSAVRSLWGQKTLAKALPQRGLSRDVERRSPSGSLRVHVEVGLRELEGYMRSMLLRDTDALAMAQGVELRVPFLDERVVLDALARAGATQAEAFRNKQSLRALAQSLLPASVLERRKHGFVLPMQRWMDGPLAGYVRTGLEHVHAQGFVAGSFVDEVVADMRRGRTSWSRPWALAVLGHWAARHLPQGAAA